MTIFAVYDIFFMVIAMDNNDIEVGKRIFQIIKQKKIKQAKFAKTIQFSASHVSNVINARSKANDRFLSNVAYKYNISFNWLKTGIGSINDVEKETQNMYAMNLFNQLTSTNKNVVLKFAEFLYQEQDNK